jgi:hypothetical protein
MTDNATTVGYQLLDRWPPTADSAPWGQPGRSSAGGTVRRAQSHRRGLELGPERAQIVSMMSRHAEQE